MLAAFALLGWLVSWLVPDIGTWFLDYARAVAALDVPGRVVALFSGR